jgi:3-oxoacyl-(acyl-carrier-protein) synthase
MPRRKILITGTGAVCASGMDVGAILAAARDGRSAIGAIAQWDTTGWPVRVAAEMPDFNPRALVEDRKLHKLIRRSDMFGLYAGSRRAMLSMAEPPRHSTIAADSTLGRAAVRTCLSTNTFR